MGPGFPGMHGGEKGGERHQEAETGEAVALHRPCLSQEEKSDSRRTDPASKGHPDRPPISQTIPPAGPSAQTDPGTFSTERSKSW